MEALAEEKGFVPNFAEFEANRAGEPSWLADLRHGAIARFQKLGFPTAKVEQWRYTNVGPIVAIPWTLARTGQGQPALASATPPAGVRVARLSEILLREPELLRERLGQIAGSATRCNSFRTHNGRPWSWPTSTAGRSAKWPSSSKYRSAPSRPASATP